MNNAPVVTRYRTPRLRGAGTLWAFALDGRQCRTSMHDFDYAVVDSRPPGTIVSLTKYRSLAEKSFGRLLTAGCPAGHAHILFVREEP